MSNLGLGSSEEQVVQVSLQGTSPEAIAYKLMQQIIGPTENNQYKVLAAYKECLKAVKGKD